MRTPLRRAGMLGTLAGGLLLASGCFTVGPDYKRVTAPPPDAWHVKLTDGVATGEADFQTWWNSFHDPALNQLIDAAAKNSRTLDQAAARVRESKALLGIAVSGFSPQISMDGDAIRSRASEDIGIPSAAQKRTDWYYSAGLGASWELDFWGRIWRGMEASWADANAQVEAYRDSMVILFAAVGNDYVEARALLRRIEYTEKNVMLQRESLRLASEKYKAELVSELDVHQAELSLSSTEATLPDLRAQLNATLNRLAVLTGQPVADVEKTIGTSGVIPAVPATLVIGLPAEALRMRPDLRQAERQLAAATARIGVAKAELYPQFSLLGSFGYQSTGSLFEASNRVWSFGPAFRWRLFEGGAVRSGIAAQEAQAQQAYAAYYQAVLVALADGETSIGWFLQEQQRYAALTRSVNAASKGFELVQQLYKTELTSFLNVLDMQRSLTVHQDQLAQCEGRRAQYLIQVYKAMGGGWPTGVAKAKPTTEPATK